MADPPRIYTYKVTFEEIPHWYWGVHKEEKYGELYLGSPKTNAWMWKFYTPQIQILELFPHSETGWKEANEVENRIIIRDLNNPLCLNEACAGTVSLKVCSESGKKGGKACHAEKNEDGKSAHAVKMGRSTFENRTGIFSATPEEKSNWCQVSGKIGGSTTAARGYFDINSPNSIKTPESLRKGALSQHAIRVRCKITGHVSTPCGLSQWQKARGINHLDPNNREKVNVEN
jgi:hypothetical protein